jgi:hypothetical protein
MMQLNEVQNKIYEIRAQKVMPDFGLAQPETIKYSPVTPFAFTEQGVAMFSYDAMNYLYQKDKIRTEQNDRKQIGYTK